MYHSAPKMFGDVMGPGNALRKRGPATGFCCLLCVLQKSTLFSERGGDILPLCSVLAHGNGDVESRQACTSSHGC